MTEHINDTLIHDYVDGWLAVDDLRQAEAHLGQCAACRAEVQAIVELRTAARALSHGIAPARDLWPGIALRLEPDARLVPSPRLRFLRPVLAAAAAVLVLLTALLTTDRFDEGAPGEAADNEKIERAILSRMEMTSVETQYEAAARDLQAALDLRRSDLAPETAAIIEKNLGIIDAALRESKRALVADPANRTLTDLVASTHRKKMEFLQLALNY